MPNKLTQKEYINKACEVHNNKYSYEELEYFGADKKVKIHCLKCNKYFFQNANSHLHGAGCPYCANKENSRRMSNNTDEFIKKAQKIHGNKYDYSNVKYKNSTEYILIHCNTCHTDFIQRPYKHLQGKICCPKCISTNIKKQNSSTKDEFIEKARNIYEDKYDYSNIIYTNNREKVKIYCKQCNKYFLQTPHLHLSGHGCPFCAIKKRIMSQKMSLEEFKEKARNIHGNLYNYDEVFYVNNHTKVKIKCNLCNNWFEQLPNKHLCGQGCSYCQGSSGEKCVTDFLNKNSILYKTQKTFKDCKDKALLRFDFYLPDYATCIEFQGMQHYDPKMFITLFKSESDGLEKFKLQQYHDKLKVEYCSLNNLKLITINSISEIKEKLDFLIKSKK